MLDKSPRHVSESPSSIMEELGRCMPGIVLCSEPFDKMEFLDVMISCTTYSVVFVDMDLLYTGYVKSGMIRRRNDVEIFRPSRQDWMTEFAKIVLASSKGRTLIVIDSLNGMHGAFDDIESARFVNSCIMLLASLGRQADSLVIVTAMVRPGNGRGWVLAPGGRQIIRSREAGCYFLKKVDGRLLLEPVLADKIEQGRRDRFQTPL